MTPKVILGIEHPAYGFTLIPRGYHEHPVDTMRSAA
jgi:hypothetical protein